MERLRDCRTCAYRSPLKNGRAFCRNDWVDVPMCSEIFCCVDGMMPLTWEGGDAPVFCECAPGLLTSIQSCSGWKRRPADGGKTP